MTLTFVQGDVWCLRISRKEAVLLEGPSLADVPQREQLLFGRPAKVMETFDFEFRAQSTSRSKLIFYHGMFYHGMFLRRLSEMNR